MVSWSAVVAAEPEFAARVRRLFGVRRHKTLATLRRDGSPRISGIEAQFADGEVWLGMMPGSLKAADLRRDPRLALHSPTQDPPEEDPGAWPGEAKLAGRATEVADPQRPDQASHRFRVEVTEVVLTRVGEPADHLVIESWHQGRGFQRRQRR
jgi:Pyridoxamine 5'-phosphate oxidase